MGRLNALNLTDQGSVVVLTTNKQLRFGTNLHNFGAIKHQFFLNCLGRGALGFVLRRFGGGNLSHVFLRFGKQKLNNLGNCISPLRNCPQIPVVSVVINLRAHRNRGRMRCYP